MALVGIAGVIIGTWAVGALLGQLGGDPEGDVMAEIQKNQGLDAARAQRPLHSMRREIREDEMEMAAGQRQMSSSNIEAQKVRVGRRSQGPQAGLDEIAAQMGVTPEDLSAKLSPDRAGDYSDASRIAYGRSPKRLRG